MARYSGDPYWITCEYPGTCRRCRKTIDKGDRAFKYKDGSLYGGECGCGEQASREFYGAADDEDFYMGQY